MTDVIQPVVSASQHEKILGFLNEAEAAGIEIYTGGGVPDPTIVENSGGYFIQPTILTNVPPTQTLGKRRYLDQCFQCAHSPVKQKPLKKQIRQLSV